MTREELLDHAEAMIGKFQPLVAAQSRDRGNFPTAEGHRAEVEAFLRDFAGTNSPFARRAVALSSYSGYADLLSLIVGFRDYVRAGLWGAASPERQARLEVASDLLEQATALLGDTTVHPAAAVMVVGATLEEFLRNWVEHLDLNLGQRKPGIQAYTDTLRDAGAITKQNVKDLVSWGGLRNHAAHGNWDEVADRSRAHLMLEGVNLFISQHSPR
jgi:hypothetical protein